MKSADGNPFAKWAPKSATEDANPFAKWANEGTAPNLPPSPAKQSPGLLASLQQGFNEPLTQAEQVWRAGVRQAGAGNVLAGGMNIGNAALQLLFSPVSAPLGAISRIPKIGRPLAGALSLPFTVGSYLEGQGEKGIDYLLGKVGMEDRPTETSGALHGVNQLLAGLLTTEGTNLAQKAVAPNLVTREDIATQRELQGREAKYARGEQEAARGYGNRGASPGGTVQEEPAAAQDVEAATSRLRGNEGKGPAGAGGAPPEAQGANYEGGRVQPPLQAGSGKAETPKVEIPPMPKGADLIAPRMRDELIKSGLPKKFADRMSTQALWESYNAAGLNRETPKDELAGTGGRGAVNTQLAVSRARDVLDGRTPTARVVATARKILGGDFDPKLSEFIDKNSDRLAASQKPDIEKGALTHDFAQRVVAAKLLGEPDIYSDLRGKLTETEKGTAQPKVSPSPKPGQIVPGYGVGAARAEEFGTPTSLNELTEQARGVSDVTPISPRERLSDALRATNARTRTMAPIGRAYERVKAAASSVWNVLAHPPKYDSYDKLFGAMDANNQMADAENRTFSAEMVRKFPRISREAMVNYIQSGGDETTLRDWASRSKGSLKRGYEAALTLTPDERTFANNLSTYYEARLKQGIDAGILHSAVDNYLSGIWDKPNDASNRLSADLAAGKLPTNFKAAMQKIFANYFEGEQAGYKPKIKDVAALTSVYDQAFNRVLNARAFIKGLHDGTAADGRPWVELSGARTEIPGGDAPPEAVLVKPRVRPASIGDYKPVDHPALRGWKWAATDANGNPVLYQADMLVHPEVYERLKNQLEHSSLADKGFGTLLKIQSGLKGTKLSLSLFPQVQEGVHALFHRVNPFTPDKIDLRNDPVQYQLAAHGAKFADFRSLQQWTEGVAGGGLLTKIPGIGPLLQRYNDWLFRDYIPGLKSEMMKAALERNMERYKGKLTEDQIYKLTANQGNAAFAELNYAAMGRNPFTQSVLRFAFLAPDFLEARARFVGQAFTRYGGEQRVALALMGVTVYAAGRILNEALDGNPHWDMPFEVVHDNRRYGLRTIAGDMEHAWEDPRGFIYYRISPIVRGATELMTKRDWQGIKRDPLEQLRDLASWLVPMSLQGTSPALPGYRADQGLVPSFLASTGVGSARYTKSMRVAAKARDWLKRTGRETVEQRTGVTIPSEYAPLTHALDAGDTESAKKAYRDLLTGTVGQPRTPGDIARYYGEYAARPFTGSRAKDRAFYESLSTEDKKLYEEAIQEREQTMQEFAKLVAQLSRRRSLTKNRAAAAGTVPQ